MDHMKGALGSSSPNEQLKVSAASRPGMDDNDDDASPVCVEESEDDNIVVANILADQMIFEVKIFPHVSFVAERMR